MIAAGIIGGLLAAVFGLIDWTAIPSGTRAKTIGLLHGGTNVLVTLLFIVSWFIRNESDAHVATTAALVCSFVGVGLALVGGWLGGELVDRLGIGVDPGAHPNAPNSLSGRPAAESEARPSLRRVA
jgi:uncharacterized membrane protein